MKTTTGTIQYPFQKGVSPYITLLGKWARECITCDYESLPDVHRKIALETNYGDVAAYYYPTASYQKIFPICGWMIYVGCYDDTFGTWSRELLEPMNKRIDTVYRGGDLLPADTGLGAEFLRQIKIIMNGFRPFVTPAWERRFAANNKLFLDALVTATGYNYKQDLHCPSLEEYLDIRQNIVAVYPCANMAEVVAEFILPEEVLAHPAIRRINQLTALLMAFCNDFFSVERERRDREVMNLILVIEQERSCSFECARAAALETHDHFVNEFQQLCSSLPDFGELNPGLARYILTLKLMIHGNLMWHLTTTRHRV